eukprot:6119781-Karenia_brevis.AAC.1
MDRLLSFQRGHDRAGCESRTWHIQFDGGARVNVGHAAGACAVCRGESFDMMELEGAMLIPG